MLTLKAKGVTNPHWRAQMAESARLMSVWAKTVEDAIVWKLGATKSSNLNTLSNSSGLNNGEWAEQLEEWARQMYLWANSVHAVGVGLGARPPRFTKDDSPSVSTKAWREKMQDWGTGVSDWARRVENKIWP